MDSEVERAMRRSQGYGDIKRDPKPKKQGSAMKASIRYADSWFSKLIILRDKRCVTCGSTESLQCSHVFRRHSYTTRWDIRNAVAQCKSCHFSHHTRSEYPLQNEMLKRLGQYAMDELWLRSKQISDFSADTIEAFGDSFREQCGRMM